MSTADSSMTQSPASALHDGAEFRQQPRVKLPAMYTLVRVKQAGTQRYRWTGYVYDISATGMRLELDDALPAGTRIEVRVMLPGMEQTTFSASGTIIRLHDDARTPGPVRMGMAFESFPFIGDERRLQAYLENAGRRLAGAKQAA